MKTLQIATLFTCVLMAFGACKKKPEISPIPITPVSIGTKLKKIEFKDNQAPNATQVWTLLYTADKATEITSNTGSKITLVYQANLLIKVNYYANGSTISAYQDLAYNGSGELTSVELKAYKPAAAAFVTEYRHVFQYAAGVITRKDVYGNGWQRGYQLYTYGSDGNVFEVKSYDAAGVYEGKYAYETYPRDNKLKDALPQPQVFAAMTERQYQYFQDIDLHFQNQYINRKHIAKETMIFTNNQVLETNTYQFTFNDAGMVTGKTDNTGHFIRYIYE